MKTLEERVEDIQAAMESSYQEDIDLLTRRDKRHVEQIQQLLEALKLAYRKHHLDDVSVGWEELGEAMGDALAETMGDKEFVRWTEKVVEGKHL